MGSSNKWLHLSEERAKIKLRLICFHHAGGSASFFQNWSRELPDYVQTCSVQLPGRWDRIAEPAFKDMRVLVPALIDELKDLSTTAYAVAGYSFGAKVAFEFVRSLRRIKAQMPLVFFSFASRSPPIQREGKTLYSLQESELIDFISQNYGPFPEEVLREDSIRSLLVGILRSDLQILETYKYTEEPAFNFPIVALGGREDQMVDSPGLADWHKQTLTDFSMRMFSGGHFFAENLSEEVKLFLTHHINNYASNVLKNN